jgi:hypothetical protein
MTDESKNLKAIMSVRQASELDRAFARNGYTAADVKMLSAGTLLAQVLSVMRGRDKIVEVERIAIDLEVEPITPDGLSIVYHNKLTTAQNISLYASGFCTSDIQLYLTPDQENNEFVAGGVMSRYVKNEKRIYLNAVWCNFFSNNTDLIPDTWINKTVCFWGTQFRDDSDLVYIFTLKWNGVTVISGAYCIKDGFDKNHLAACFTKFDE